MGLDVPQVTQAAYELKKRGFDIRADVLSVEELYNELIGKMK